MGAFTDPTDMAKTMANVYERFPRLKERKRASWRARFPAVSSRCWPWARADGQAQDDLDG